MIYLLDTNVIIDILATSGNDILLKNIEKHTPKDLAVSGFTEAELSFGIEKSDPQNRETNRLIRATLLGTFQRIYLDEEISNEYGRVKAYLDLNGFIPNKKTTTMLPHMQDKNEIDIFIAATAIAKNLTLITRNTKDFINIPNIKLQNWYV